MAAPKAVETPEAFVSILKKSQLLTAEQLQKAEQLAQGSDDPKLAARKMMKESLLTGWQAGQMLAGFHALTIGKYKLCKQLGADDLGRVFLAEHAPLSRMVALKTLSSRHTRQEKVVQRFLADARDAARLDHRNIVHVYDVDSEGERYYVVMEYVEGRNLQQVVDEDGVLTPQKAADLIRQACHGLAHAHGQNMTHGAISPTTLMVDGQGVLKIFDFGVAQLAQSDGTSASSYAAPEQAVDSAAADARSDVFALGCTLCFLLSGKPPARTVGEKPSVGLDVLRGKAPQELIEICQQMTAVDAAARLASAELAAEKLQQWLDSAKPSSGAAKPSIPAKDTATQKDTDAIALPKARPIGPPTEKREETATRSKPQSEKKRQAGDNPLAGINIDTGSGKSSPKPQKAKAGAKQNADPSIRFADKPTAAGSQKKTPSVAARRKTPLGLIIGAIGGGVGLLIVAILAVILLWGSGDEDVAQANQAAAGAAAADDAPPARIEVDPVMNPEVDPADEAATSTAAGDASAPAADAVTEATTLTPATDNPANSAAPSEEPPAGDPPAAEPSAPAAAPTEATPPATEAAAPAVASSEPAKAEEEKPAEAAPTTAESSPPAAAKPAAANAFRDLAASVDLPPLEGADGPAVLGTVHLDDKTLCFIKIRGGENAVRGATKFTMRNAEGGLAERDWEIFSTSERGEGDLVIARVSLKDQQLGFEWTPEAASEKSAEYLRNCQLSLSADAENHVVGLRKPIELAPLALDLNKPATKEEWRIDAAPDPESIEVQITAVGGPFPGAARFDPPQPLSAARGSQRVLFGDNPEEHGMYLVVETNMRRSLEITVTPMFKIGELPAANFNKSKVETAARAAQGAVANAKLKVQQLTNLKNRKLNPQQLKRLVGIDDPKQIDNEINLANQDFDKFSGLASKLENLKALVAQLDGAAHIEFRAYMRAGASEVDLVRTTGAAQGANPDASAMADAK